MKSRRGGKPTSSASASPENTTDNIEDEGGAISEFSQIDIKEQCPKYNTIVEEKLTKVPIEDIDPLQLELETLLVAVVQRKQQLRAQLEALDHDDTLSLPSKPPRPEKHKAPLSPPGSTAKKFKPNTFEQKSTKKPSKEKSKKTNTSLLEAAATTTPAEPTVSAQKSNRFPVPVAPFLAKDSPHRFWTYLEDYCKSVGVEQIQVLEDMLEAQEAIKSSDYVKVPSLGTHYTVKWAQEDLLEEQRESTPDLNSSKLKEDMEKVLRKTAKESLSDERYGSITQRLMSCLIEDTLFVKAEDLPIVTKGRSSACNIASLEQRIRKELEDLGVMQALAEKVAEEDDEVFLELRKCQSQLLSISSQNVRLIKKVLSAARQRMAEVAIETRLRAVDDEILEHFRKRKGVSKAKNAPIILVPPTKKEKEHLQSLLDKRKAILAQLNGVETTS